MRPSALAWTKEPSAPRLLLARTPGTQGTLLLNSGSNL